MTTKNLSVFYPDHVITKIRENVLINPKVKTNMEQTIHTAQRFASKEDAELWNLIVDPGVFRSHYVNKNSLCPVCHKKRVLYDWEIDPVSYPWKVRCPDCKNLFPKNDYLTFYKSGIDETGVFRYDRADKTLLYNMEHPDPEDPLHFFAVDDGNGYQNGETVQRFIGAYLMQGHHKDLIGGISALSLAYIYTGQPEYAHKCAVLLDRLADHWPNYDACCQVYMYDVLNITVGYFGYWYFSYSDISTMAHALDMIRSVILEDQELLKFIQTQKEKYSVPYRKNSSQDICDHIRVRILDDALSNYKKCNSNFPMTHALYAIIHAVNGNHEQVDSLLKEIITISTECDGASKENGLMGYTNGAKKYLTEILLKFVNIKPRFIESMMEQYPSLIEAYRFFIDTLCIDEYYPKIGDCGAFTKPSGGCIHDDPGSLYMLYKCYEVTGEPLFIQSIWSSVKEEYENVFSGFIFLSQREKDCIIEEIKKVLSERGTEMLLPSVVKPSWHLAVLRSGKGKNKRALWIDFDWINSGHEHIDPMNIGLFCMGVDIMPDWGYPTVVYEGDFHAEECKWGKSPFVHNCAMMDRSPGQKGVGSVDLWAIGENIKSITCQNPKMLKDGKQYARTLSLVDISEDDFYAVDLFRMCGSGQLYERYIHSAVGSVTTFGILANPVENEFDRHLFFENVRRDDHPMQGWSADFDVEDYFNYVDEKKDRHMKCTDLTFQSKAMIADVRFFGNRNYEQFLKHELLLPCVITQRTTEAPYQPVVFAQVIEPYEGSCKLSGIERLTTEGLPEGCVVIKVSSDRFTDLLIYNDPYDSRIIELPEYSLKTDAMVSMVRFVNDTVKYFHYSKGTYLHINGIQIENINGKETLEKIY